MYPKFYQPQENEAPNIIFYLGGGVTDEGAILYSFFGNSHQCADRALTHGGAEYGVTLLQDRTWHVLTKPKGASAFSGCGFTVNGADEAQALAAVREAVSDYLYLDGNPQSPLGQCESLVKQLADYFIMWGPDALTGAFIELSDTASKRQLCEMEGLASTLNDDKVLAWINREDFSANALKHMISFITAAGALTADEARQMKVQMRLGLE